MYEGEFKNNGNKYLKKYHIDGKLLFENEYINGQKNGKMKIYHYGKLIFDGEYISKENKKMKEKNIMIMVN